MPPIGPTFTPIQRTDTPPPAPSAAPPNVTVRPADGVQGKVGLMEVTVDGVTRYMTRQEADDLLQALAPLPDDDEDEAPAPTPRRAGGFDKTTGELAARPDQISDDEIYGRGAAGAARAMLAGQSVLGQVGPFAIAVPPPSTPPTPGDPPPATKGPQIVQATTDKVVAQSTSAFEARTGHSDRLGLAKGSLAGANELSIVSHGTSADIDFATRAGEKILSPRQLAKAMVEAGWQGGTVRLVACNTGVGGEASFAQRLANELAARGAYTVVAAPEGGVTVMGEQHGLPRVYTQPDAQNNRVLQEPGKGWGYFAGEEPKGWQVDRQALRPGAWKGAGIGMAQNAAFIALGHLHAQAVAERVQQQAAKEGWADYGPTGDKLYDFGAWLLDPTNEASRSVPFSRRFDMDTWRVRMKDAADAKPVGATYECTWTTSDGQDVLGNAKTRTFDAVYRKLPDGSWRTESCDGCEDGEVPPDLNRIIDPRQSNEDIRQYLQLPPPWSDLA